MIGGEQLVVIATLLVFAGMFLVLITAARAVDKSYGNPAGRDDESSRGRETEPEEMVLYR
jgi:hypothetical protein